VTQPSPPTAPPPLRIAYLLADGGVPFFDSRKGASIHARAMARAFADEGCEVTVFALRAGNGLARHFDLREIKRSTLTRWFHERVMNPLGRRARGRPAGRAAGRANLAAAWGVLLWQADFLRQTLASLHRGPPDLLYARHAWLAFPYYRLQARFNVPLLVEVNALQTIERRARGQLALARLTGSIERRTLERAALLLPVTAELRRQILGLGIEREKVVVTPNGVDLEAFRPGPPAEPSPNGDFVVGCASSFKPYHGHEVLFEAARRLEPLIPGLKLRLIGGGPEGRRLRGLAETLGIAPRVEFTGAVDHERVPELLRGCDVGVTPYVGDQNLYGCPMKLVEYMALKLPIVSAAWGDIPNTLRHGETALLHAPGDAEALAAALLEIHRDRAAARRRAETAYAEVQERSWRATARGILDQMNARRAQVTAG